MAIASPAEDLRHVKIRADAPAAAIDVRELFRYRDLLLTLAERDVRIRYKQTALGVAWVVLQPLIASMIFAFVFGVVAGLPSDGRPYVLFALGGVLAWGAFSNALTWGANALVRNSQMVAKVYFPRPILPLASILATLLDFVVGLVVMAVLLVYYQIRPGMGLLLLPVWLSILLILALGLSLGTGAMMVRYRDVQYIIPVVLQIGMYASPVAWSSALVPERHRWVVLANPLSGLIEAFRWSLLGDGFLSPWGLAYSTAAAFLALWVGAAVFKQQERNFADVI